MGRIKKILAGLLAIVLFASTAVMPVGAAGVFTDVKSGDWYYDSVFRWSWNGVLNGYEDGSFRPMDNVRRSEFAKIIATTLGLKDQAENIFEDVSEDDWYAPYVLACVKAGIIDGYEVDGKRVFRAKEYITRQEAIKIYVTALGLTGGSDGPVDGFSDGSQVDAWARGYVNTILTYGAMQGRPDGSLAPGDNISRAEVAIILDRLVGVYVDAKGSISTTSEAEKDKAGNLVVIHADWSEAVAVRVKGDRILVGTGDAYLEHGKEVPMTPANGKTPAVIVAEKTVAVEEGTKVTISGSGIETEKPPSENESTEPTETEPAVTTPTEPDVTEPTEPDVTEPSETEPAEPETTEPVEPEVTEPTEPEPTEPEATEPTEPEPTEPEVTEPTEPEPTEPEVTEPTEPESTEPEMTEPTEPEPSEPPATQPTEPEQTEPPATEPVEPEKSLYRVSVVDYNGNPVPDVEIQVKNDGEVLTTVVADSKGVAETELEQGDYTLELLFPGEAYYYDPNEAVWSADKSQIQVKLAQFLGSEFKGTNMGNAYFVSVGGTYLTMEPSAVNYYLFGPEVAGQYRVSTSDPSAKLSYWGGNRFYLIDSTASVGMENNSYILNVKDKNLGGTHVLGVTGAGECVLEIVRIGDPVLDETDVPYTDYEGTIPVTPYTYTGTGTEKDYINILGKNTKADLVYNDQDGYYHLNSADGAVVYMDLTAAAPYIPLYSIIGMGGVGGENVARYIYDDNGTLVTKERYNALLQRYAENADKHLGIYPLNDDLIYMIQEGGNRKGWWDPESPNFMFDDYPNVNTKLAWMFACCTVE